MHKLIAKKILLPIFLLTYLILPLLSALASPIYAQAPDDITTTIDSEEINEVLNNGTDIIIDANFLPIIAFENRGTDDGMGNLGFCQCTNAYCSEYVCKDVYDATHASHTGEDPAIGINPNNDLPIFAFGHRDTSDNDTLAVCTCLDAACDNVDCNLSVDSAVLAGFKPEIFYYNEDLSIFHISLDGTSVYLRGCTCFDGSCVDSGIINCENLHSELALGYISVANSFNNEPLIAVAQVHNTNSTLGYVKTNPNFSEIHTNTFTGTSTTSGYVSIISNPNIPDCTDWTYGCPMISYFNTDNEDLEVCTCNNQNCDDITECHTIEATGSTGWHSAMVLGLDGNPFITYTSDNTLKLCKCQSPDCSQTPDCKVIYNDEASHPSITRDAKGMPIVAYREDTTQNLHVYYGKSFMPLLDTTINLEQISDNSAEVQTHAYYYVDGGFIKKTTTSAPDGSIDDHVMGSYPNHNIAFSLYPLYLKPKNYLSQTTILDTEYGDNNNPSFDTAFICGDLNNDDQVSGPDFSIFLTHYGHSAEADFNGDDVTNAMDFALFVKNYGEEGAYIEDTTHNWDWDG